ncbi:chemotaxis protein CheW [Oceanisphaera avium]|uniref:CheW-like domain-containing protein n=1 Tax=Oceanisphaera avium TaxID=1903694 RepID=A0A1Y0CWH4_9GAMM|nr:chemotaxis protein CheW [Oceanisphaera avium]ART79710.1 hypothetical protein CBP12_05725 [Oceanisphaera avium]
MKQPYADVLDDYFDALLEEHPSAELQPKVAPIIKAEPTKVAPYAEPSEAERRQALEALLAKVAELNEAQALETPAPQVVKPQPKVAPISAPEVVTPKVETAIAPAKVVAKLDIESQSQLATEQALASAPVTWRNMETEHSFQVLFFEVAGMTFAVPLTHLGGIYQVTKLTSLFGKPDWFSGVQTQRDRQIYAVDTARWAMPGHSAQEEYGYLVTLGESHWGLGCHQLKGTALLTREQVKWRTTPGTRPWLAGMVKEKMCALLHVDALVALLEQGKNIDGQQA